MTVPPPRRENDPARSGTPSHWYEAGVSIPGVENPTVPHGYQHLGAFPSHEEALHATVKYVMGAPGQRLSYGGHVTRLEDRVNEETGRTETHRIPEQIYSVFGVGEHDRNHPIETGAGWARQGRRSVTFEKGDPFAEHKRKLAWSQYEAREAERKKRDQEASVERIRQASTRRREDDLR